MISASESSIMKSRFVADAVDPEIARIFFLTNLKANGEHSLTSLT